MTTPSPELAAGATGDTTQTGATDVAPTAPPALELRGLIAGYDGVPAVHGVDLQVGEGEVVALLGSNGAGKTTTLLTISGLLPSVAGEVVVLGEVVRTRKRMRTGDVCGLARRGVAHVPEDRGLFFDLTAREHLRLARRRGQPQRPLDQVLEWFPTLSGVLDRRAGLLSGGEQQMLALARALSGAPRLLLIDEMSLGLAPIIVSQLLPVLRSIAVETDTAMLLVEQHVSLVLQFADRAAVMRGGRIVTEGPAAELATRRDILEEGYLGEGETSTETTR